MEASFIYITCKDKAEALHVGKALLRERLVACINIVEGMTSAYWWEGEILEDSEAILIAKSRPELLALLTKKVREVHSYEVPCVVSLPIGGGNPAYLRWIAEETGK